jgi:hypothetical protein
MAAKITLKEWLGQIIGKAPGGAARVDLCEWRTSGPGPRITFWNVSSGADLESIATEVQATAASDGAGHAAARVPYMLLALSPESGESLHRYPLDVPGSGVKPGDAYDLAGASDLAGVTSQLMRANNDTHALLIKAHQNRDDGYLKIIALLQDRLGKHETRITDLLDAQQRLMAYTLEREELREQRKHADKRDEQLVEQLGIWGPVVLNRLLGGGGGKGAPAGSLLIESILGSLQPDQIKVLMDGELLTAEQKIALGELYMSFASRRKHGLNDPSESKGGSGT